jgi:hypothetical protein
MVLMGYSGAGGKLIHKKTRSKKSRDTVPLNNLFLKSGGAPVIFLGSLLVSTQGDSPKIFEFYCLVLACGKAIFLRLALEFFPGFRQHVRKHPNKLG